MQAVILKKIAAVRRRLRVLCFYATAMRMLSLATALAALAFLADKLKPLPVEDRTLWITWLALMGVAVLGSAVYAAARRLTMLDAAITADLRLGLKERLSSAIALRSHEEDDPAVAALVEDAHRFAQTLHPAQQFAFSPSWRSFHLLWPAAALFGVYFLMPQFNLFGASSQPHISPQAQAVAEAIKKSEAEKIEKIAERTREEAGEENRELAKYSAELDKLARELKSGQKNERLALAEMSRISEDVRLKRQDMARQIEDFQKPGPSLKSQKAGEMSKAIEKLDFDKAAEIAREMEKSFAGDGQNSTAQEKQQAAADMKQMAQEMAKNNPDMAKAMEQAAQAMEKAAQAQASGDQQAMREAAQQAQEAMGQAAQEMANMAESVGMMNQLDQLQQSLEQQKREMAKNCGMSSSSQSNQQDGQSSRQSQQGSSGETDGSQQPGGQQGDSQREGSGSGEGEGEMAGQQGGQRRGQGTGTGPWREGFNEEFGRGMGGPGRGRGGEAQYDDSTAPGFDDTLPPGVKNEGEIIAAIDVDGPAMKGESKVEYKQVFTEYRQKADEAIQRETIPIGYRNAVREYFDAISPEVQSKEKAK